MHRFTALIFSLIAFGATAQQQQWGIEQLAPRQWRLTLTDSTGDVTGEWVLRYPVFRFATADINGDGSTDAVVGLFKASRYFTTPSRRVFIFKNYNGDVRPLWLGSRLGGDLVDFTIEGNNIRAIEQRRDGSFVVSDYCWRGFGMAFVAVINTFTNLNDAYNFLQINNTTTLQP